MDFLCYQWTLYIFLLTFASVSNGLFHSTTRVGHFVCPRGVKVKINYNMVLDQKETQRSDRSLVSALIFSFSEALGEFSSALSGRKEDSLTKSASMEKKIVERPLSVQEMATGIREEYVSIFWATGRL